LIEHTSSTTIFDDVINFVKERVGLCEKSEGFMEKYLLNAVLSYIEESEQRLILSIRYFDWVKIDDQSVDEIRNKILDHVNRFALACRGSPLSRDETDSIRSMLSANLILRALCRLYVHGIYEVDVSKYIVIKDVPPEKCLSLELSLPLEVRSRFIELAKDLYLVKRRFPDKSVFESSYLVDRVFAYAEPRYVPISKIAPQQVIREVEDRVRQIYKLYNKYILGREPNAEEEKAVIEILNEFFANIKIKFYEYQVDGLKKILESVIAALKDEKVSINVIEAPTGSGKTEIFVLATLILSLVKRISVYYAKIQSKSPIAVIVYPRQALASNQIDRLLKYLYILNKEVKNYFERKVKSDILPPLVSLAINYGEVRYRDELEDFIRKHLAELKTEKRKEYQIRIFGRRVRFALESDDRFVFLIPEIFKCPNGKSPKLRYDPNMGTLEDVVICGDEELPYLRIVKDAVKENGGDIYVTLFETLRLNLLSREWTHVFGDRLTGGPILLVLDEIHTYVGISGARYAYTLRRAMARISVLSGRRGFVIVGVSATLPNPDDFLRTLFLIGHGLTAGATINYIRPKDTEQIPLGNEYFFLIVPTTKYPVDLLSVSIQAVMVLFYNIPALPTEDKGKYRKRAFVFVDDLNTIKRFKEDLKDAIYRKNRPSGYCRDEVYGLQDLRNTLSSCFKQAIQDFGDALNVGELPVLWKLYEYSSWRNGELWWGYILDAKEGLRFGEVEEFTSRYKGRIDDASIIVATSTLEVGVDYSDVVVIYQHGMPPNLSAFIQRAGRAGRRLFENPLTRTVVAAQLSPEIQTQSAYFKIFTTVESLRKALEYDRLYVSTRNDEVIKQTLAEVLLEHMVHSMELSTMVSKDIAEFECKDILNRIIKLNQSPEIAKQLMEYIEMIFPSDARIKEFIGEIIGYIMSECKKLRMMKP